MNRWWLVFFIILMAVACKRHYNRAPEIYLTQYPETIADGDTFRLRATLVDHEALISAVLYFNIDSTELTTPATNLQPAYSFSRNYNLSGSTAFLADSIILPDSFATGQYNMLFTATNAEGFLNLIQKTITVTSKVDTLAPEIDTLTLADTVDVATPMFLTVKMHDNIRLASLRYTLKNASSTTLLDTLIPLSDTLATYNSFIFAPETIGRYTLKITVRDWINQRISQTLNIVAE